MNKDTSQETEKRMERERINNQGQVFPSPYPAPPSGDHQWLKKSAAGKGEISDSLTATYWG